MFKDYYGPEFGDSEETPEDWKDDGFYAPDAEEECFDVE